MCSKIFWTLFLDTFLLLIIIYILCTLLRIFSEAILSIYPPLLSSAKRLPIFSLKTSLNVGSGVKKIVFLCERNHYSCPRNISLFSFLLFLFLFNGGSLSVLYSSPPPGCGFSIVFTDTEGVGFVGYFCRNLMFWESKERQQRSKVAKKWIMERN